MKLEIGMYLRHNGLDGDYPIIQKITKLKTPGRCGGKYKVFTDKCGDWFIDSDYIEIKKSKYSFDIRDLIEVGDYVNGERVTPIMLKMYKEQGIFGIPDKYNAFVDEIHIKTILTHEQFENNCYKVGDE